jgi:hypothetical protein
MPEEEVVTLEEAGVVAENIDTTTEEVVAETVSETVEDNNVDVATEVVETVEEVA